MIARDVGRVGCPHSRNPLGDTAGVIREARPPGLQPAFYPGIGRKQLEQPRLLARVCRQVGESAEGESKIRVGLLHDRQKTADQLRITVQARGESDLAAHSLEKEGVESGDKRLQHFRRQRYRLVGIGIDQWQQCFSEPRQVPLRDRRLVRIRIPSVVIDRAEDRLRVVFVHEGAGTVVDGLTRDGHVVRVHDAVDEAHQHPAGDEGELPLGNFFQDGEGRRNGFSAG